MLAAPAAPSAPISARELIKAKKGAIVYIVYTLSHCDTMVHYGEHSVHFVHFVFSSVTSFPRYVFIVDTAKSS